MCHLSVQSTTKNLTLITVNMTQLILCLQSQVAHRNAVSNKRARYLLTIKAINLVIENPKSMPTLGWKKQVN